MEDVTIFFEKNKTKLCVWHTKHVPRIGEEVYLDNKKHRIVSLCWDRVDGNNLTVYINVI